MDDWRPAASLENLRRRAALIARIRLFFAARGVLEVETPLLAAAAVTDLHLASFELDAGGERRYLQTSPEFAMKRLLAAGSGPIYQLGKAFRDGEVGRLHNPEFTLLEWYRPGFDHHALMDEVDAFLGEILGLPPAERIPYGELFERHLGIDPHRAGAAELRRCVRRRDLDVEGLAEERDPWLDVLLSHVLEPRLGRGRPTFVYDYPASQAALARLRDGDPPVAERFEVYVEGIELANGYHELVDAAEQRRRFAADLARRRERGLPAVAMDERLLAALDHGLPPCAGVALGVDRLALLATGGDALADVVAFPFDRA
ncbi:MAG: EF-P lysine aminoacylase GenX [Acidobacteria bacterium]|nr:MAG: EF-P lysine aminoacylase GenX [Acidobacteriota bacterium]